MADSEDSDSDSKSAPDSKCPICLNYYLEKSAPDECLHFFCFQCILRWSKIKPECPLCKISFSIIRMNFISNDDYKPVPVGAPEVTPVAHYDDNIFYLNSLTAVMSGRNIEFGLTRFRPPSFRLFLYQQRLHMLGFSGPRLSQREVTPERFRYEPALFDRIRPWLFREMEAIGNFALHRCVHQIMNALTLYHIDHVLFRQSISGLIDRENLTQFIHELRSFITSPYDMHGFDLHAFYTRGLSGILEIDIESGMSRLVDDESISTYGTPALTYSETAPVIDITEPQVITISDEESSGMNSLDVAVPGRSTDSHSTRHRRRRKISCTRTRPFSSDDEYTLENPRHSSRKELKENNQHKSKQKSSSKLKLNPYHFTHENKYFRRRLRKERSKRVVSTKEDNDQVHPILVKPKRWSSVESHKLLRKNRNDDRRA